jgi:spermidine/putrescine transport system substrate-binding protein
VRVRRRPASAWSSRSSRTRHSSSHDRREKAHDSVAHARRAASSRHRRWRVPHAARSARRLWWQQRKESNEHGGNGADDAEDDDLEDINDNDTFFGKIEGPLSQGQKIGRDLIVLTDSSGLPGRMIDLGWLEKLDKSALPNIKNLQPTQAHPGWDPNREYSLPWQSGMTGIGYDPKLVGGDITSVDDLLTNPKLKGKITLLTERADTIGLVMAANGDDPSHVTDATFNKAVAKIQKAVKSGQVRQFTGNDYAPLLAKGDIYACFAWSGDMVQLQADHPGLKWVLPDSGGMIWTDNMLIPKGGNAYAASVLMNWYYRPEIAAQVEDYVNYICPVVGADKVLLKTDPSVAKNPLIFPTKAMLANVHQFDAKALNNTDYTKKFQHLIGG